MPLRFAVAFSCSLALHALAAVLLSLAFGLRGDSAADEKSPPSCVRIAVVTGEGASSAGESSSDDDADRGKTAAANPPSAPRVASVPPSGGVAQEVAPPEPGRPVVEVASFSVSMESLGGGSQDAAAHADAEGSPSGERSAPPRVTAVPSARGDIRPVYPRSARRRGEEGNVTLDVTVAADGSVESVSVVDGGSHPDLEQAAVNAARRALFDPATVDGTNAAAVVRLNLSFRLMREQ